MKILTLILSLTTILLTTTAQNQDFNFNRNEIGATLISIKSNFGQIYSMKNFYLSFFDGIDYKRHFGKNAIRIGIDYRNRNDKGSGDFVGTSSYKETRFRIGYQRLFGNNAIIPFVATDITLVNSKFQNEFAGGDWAYYLKEDLKYFGFGDRKSVV